MLGISQFESPVKHNLPCFLTEGHSRKAAVRTGHRTEFTQQEIDCSQQRHRARVVPNSPSLQSQTLRGVHERVLAVSRMHGGGHYSTMPSSATSTTSSPGGAKHMGVTSWLDWLGLSEYEQVFAGFQGVEELLSLSEAEIRDLGVRNSAHRARMVSSLVKLKEKLHKRKPGIAVPLSSLQTAFASITPPSYINHPDYGPLQNTYQPLHGLQQEGATVHTPLNTEKLDLNRYLWFHGSIPRQKAEKLLTRDGDFLLRDSISQPGDYVLTCCWKGAPLHFMVNKQHVQRAGHSKVQYQFEEELFDFVPELIQFHANSRKPISETSGAVISHAIHRETSVGYYGVKHSPLSGKHSPGQSPRHSPRQSPGGSPALPRRHPPVRTGSQPLLSLEEDPATGLARDMSGSMPSITPEGKPGKVSSKIEQLQKAMSQRVGSEPFIIKPPSGNSQQVFTGSQGDLTKSAPPKPSRVPTIKVKPESRPVIKIRNKELYEDDDKDYSDYDQVKSWPAYLKKANDADVEVFESCPGTVTDGNKSSNTLPKVNRPTATPKIGSHSFNVTPVSSGVYDIPKSARTSGTPSDFYDVPKSLKSVSDVYDVPPLLHSQRSITEGSNGDVRFVHTLPDLDAKSHFNLSSHDSEILMPNNKPLEGSAMTTMRMLLLESNAHILAQHLTYLDLQLLKVMGSHDMGLGVFSGLELLTLPQGARLRQDVMERYQCMQLFVGVTILTCPRYPERARMLHQWIQVALELKSSFGNLFGFSAVMEGLRLTQITRLKNTWIALRQNHSPSAFLFEAKLSNILRSLNEAGSALPLVNITVPHVIPLVQLLERNVLDNLLPWEEIHADCGLDIVLAHLDTARIITEQCGLYRTTSQSLMMGFHPDRGLLDMFRTETHLKLLWGCKGAEAHSEERYPKFSEVLDVLSEKMEPSELVKQSMSK